MTDVYPRSVGDLAIWARANRVTVAEARHRFAQYVALCGIASVPSLRESLVFKGGNALDFVWQPNRSTLDLDFSLDMVGTRFSANVDSIRDLLGRGFRVVTARFGVVFAINSVRQQPPGGGQDLYYLLGPRGLRSSRRSAAADPDGEQPTESAHAPDRDQPQRTDLRLDARHDRRELPSSFG